MSAYDDGKFPKVSDRKRQFKEDDGGEVKMCDLIEDYAKDYAARVSKQAGDVRRAANEVTVTGGRRRGVIPFRRPRSLAGRLP